MLSFHNDSSIKEKYLTRIKSHSEMDELVKGTYWEKGKGCAVGCTIHSFEHSQYEVELGIPEWLALVEDKFFEGLPNERAKTWPVEFLESIPLGVNLNSIRNPFLIMILKFNLNKFDHKEHPELLKLFETVIKLCEKNENNSEEYREAAIACHTYARNTESTKICSIAHSVGYAADSAFKINVYDVCVAQTTSSLTTTSEDYEHLANELLKLIKECK